MALELWFTNIGFYSFFSACANSQLHRDNNSETTEREKLHYIQQIIFGTWNRLNEDIAIFFAAMQEKSRLLTNPTSDDEEVSPPNASSPWSLPSVQDMLPTINLRTISSQIGGFVGMRPQSQGSTMPAEIPPPRGPMGFSFSPAGLLLPYHLGVATCLLDYGWITAETPISGASAGAITAAMVGLDLDMMSLGINAMYRVHRWIKIHGALQKLHQPLRRELARFIPADAYTRLSQRNTPCVVAYTSLTPFPKGNFVSHFTSNDDLLECIVASCNIPLYVTPGIFVKCRGKYCVDGYFAVKPSKFGCPPSGAARDIYILPFPAGVVKLSYKEGNAISPHLADYDYLLRPDEVRSFNEYLREKPCCTYEELKVQLGLDESEDADVDDEQQDSVGSSSPAAIGYSYLTNIVKTLGKHPLAWGSSRSDTIDDREVREWEQAHHIHASEAGMSLDGDGVLGRCPASQDPSALPGSIYGASSLGAIPTDSLMYTLPTMRFTIQELFTYALDYADDHIVRALYDIGRADAFRWMKMELRLQKLWKTSASRDEVERDAEGAACPQGGSKDQLEVSVRQQSPYFHRQGTRRSISDPGLVGMQSTSTGGDNGTHLVLSQGSIARDAATCFGKDDEG